MLERLVDAAGFKLETKLVNSVRPSVLLDRYRKDIAKVLARYPVSRVWVFGSVARGDDRPSTAIDGSSSSQPDMDDRTAEHLLYVDATPISERPSTKPKSQEQENSADVHNGLYRKKARRAIVSAFASTSNCSAYSFRPTPQN